MRRETGLEKGRFISSVITLVWLLSLAGFAAAEPASPASKPPKPVRTWETSARKSYVIPAIEIPTFIFLLNRYDRLRYGKEIYGTTANTIRDHIRDENWMFDNDAFQINQGFHPYQGTIYFGLARSAHLNYWESLFYTSAGSYMWEMAGERGPPSINDQVASGIAGSFFGEPLFRMANLLLERGGDEPSIWRKIGATFISPTIGINRLVFGERFDTLLPSHQPATFSSARLGGSLTTRLEDHGRPNIISRKEMSADFSMAYGLPGKLGYRYKRPFDYFNFEFTAVSSKNSFENVMTRGLLYGTDYEIGDNYRGVWGLYGSYDYISPHIFRVSSTAASIGSTSQWWLTRKLALQGTALAGPGFGAAGTIARKEERDYHYGGTLQSLLALRLIFGNLAMLDATGRTYYVSGVGSADLRGTERIARGNVTFTVRVYGRHAVGIQYVESRRDAEYHNLPSRNQTAKTFSVVYNLLGDTHFGAVEWRDDAPTDDR